MLARPLQSPQITQPSSWTPAVLAELSNTFEDKTPQEILAWAVQYFGGELALATSFGPQSIVMAHMLSQMNAPQENQVTLFYIDTSLLFEETYALKDKLEAQLGLTFQRAATEIDLEAQTKQFGPELWKNDSNACCYVRKVVPLRNMLNTHRAWITGIRREQSPTRANAGLVEWDHTNQIVKFNPLAKWTKKQVWDYILNNDLPYNELHDQGYPSIGCTHCTRVVGEGEDERSGRWSGKTKTECGLHVEIAAPVPM